MKKWLFFILTLTLCGCSDGGQPQSLILWNDGVTDGVSCFQPVTPVPELGFVPRFKASVHDGVCQQLTGTMLFPDTASAKTAYLEWLYGADEINGSFTYTRRTLSRKHRYRVSAVGLLTDVSWQANGTDSDPMSTCLEMTLDGDCVTVNLTPVFGGLRMDDVRFSVMYWLYGDAVLPYMKRPGSLVFGQLDGNHYACNRVVGGISCTIDLLTDANGAVTDDVMMWNCRTKELANFSFLLLQEGNDGSVELSKDGQLVMITEHFETARSRAEVFAELVLFDVEWVKPEMFMQKLAW